MRNNLIPLPTRPAPPLPILVSGAHRGAEQTQPAFEDLGKSSQVVPDITYIDPVPGRAVLLADAGRKRGLHAKGVEARLEDVLDGDIAPPALNILQVDRAATIAKAIEHAERAHYPLLGMLLVDAPRVGLIALRFAAGADDQDARRRQLLPLFRGLAAVSSRDGSREVLGVDAPPERAAVESRVRAEFRRYVGEHVAKLVAGLPPSGAIIEASLDGMETRPVAVLEGEVLEQEPHRVAERVLDERLITPRKGQGFMVIEIARLPEPTVRVRSGTIRRDHLLQVGRARDLVHAEADEQARRRVALTRTAPAPAQLDMEAVVGLALAAAAVGVATSRFPLTTTD